MSSDRISSWEALLMKSGKDVAGAGHFTLEEAARFALPGGVLLAVGDRELRQLLAFGLRMDGFSITHAKDSGEVLDHIASALVGDYGTQTFDLVLLDFALSGWSTFRVLEAIEGSCDMPVVIFNLPSQDAVDEARRLGANIMFGEAFDLEELQRAVLDVLPSGPRSRELRRSARRAETGRREVGDTPTRRQHA